VVTTLVHVCVCVRGGGVHAEINAANPSQISATNKLIKFTITKGKEITKLQKTKFSTKR